MTKDKEPIDFFDAEGNRIGTLDASAPLVMPGNKGGSMTYDEGIRMAREAGFNKNELARMGDYFVRLCELAAEREREACAEVCEAVQQKNEDNGAWMWEAKNCAEAIRARGNT